MKEIPGGGTGENFRMVVSYDGTAYNGWQRQPDRRTIQGVLEDALFRVTRQRIAVHGAGRTDAGVHALAQVASFRGALNLGAKDLFRALNAVLPRDIRISALDKAAPGFHARKSAIYKIYEYRILNAARVSPFDLRYVHHWPPRLDVKGMRKAAALFRRKADFSAFSSNRELHPVREITVSRLRRRGDEIIYTVKADGFLRYMVRTIVGTLMEVGRGKVAPETIEDLFLSDKRTLSSPTAPARGLCLLKVGYPPRVRPIT